MRRSSQTAILPRLATLCLAPLCMTAASLAAASLAPGVSFAAVSAHAGRHAHPGTTATVASQNAPAEDAIVAVVNGGIITRRAVDDRSRLFALSTGLPITADVEARLRPQITRQLIDEKLRMQEIQTHHIVITPQQIAAAIGDIEKRNRMQPNALRDRLAKDGVSLTTLIDQIRVQLGWTQVLRGTLGTRARIGNSDILQREAALKRETGQVEYNISEIFIAVEDPKQDQESLKFAQTVIKQLHAGAPFPIVAAQFSQAQTALEGGGLGWVQADELDPQVLDIVKQMPSSAVSNPIRVAGGYDIVTLLGKRQIGNQMATLLNVRQAFVPFTSALNPQAPTAQQQNALARADAIASHATSCADMETANTANGQKRPTNPGPIQLDALNPQMQHVLGALKPGHPSRPLVSGEGIAVIMVCSRETKNLADRTPDEIADQLLDERVEQTSRQLDRDLHRQATIVMRAAT